MKILFLIAALALTGCTTVYVIEPKPEAKPVDVKQPPVTQNALPYWFHGDNMIPETRVPYVAPTPFIVPGYINTNDFLIKGAIPL